MAPFYVVSRTEADETLGGLFYDAVSS
jgi:hypothetical protein